MENKYSCFHLKIPTGIITVIIGDTYVDDKKLYHIDEETTANLPRICGMNISIAMEEIAQKFEKKLFSTGGKLALHKCFHYLVKWVWNEKGEARMSRIDETPKQINFT